MIRPILEKCKPIPGPESAPRCGKRYSASSQASRCAAAKKPSGIRADDPPLLPRIALRIVQVAFDLRTPCRSWSKRSGCNRACVSARLGQHFEHDAKAVLVAPRIPIRNRVPVAFNQLVDGEIPVQRHTVAAAGRRRRKLRRTVFPFGDQPCIGLAALRWPVRSEPVVAALAGYGVSQHDAGDGIVTDSAATVGRKLFCAAHGSRAERAPRFSPFAA